MKKLSIQSIQPVLEFIKRFRFVLFLLFFTGIYVFLITSINMLNSSEPSQTAIDSKLEAVKRLDIDEKAVDKMLQLGEENIEIRSEFNEARENPFGE